jgi:Protein of unknown function (DUF1203)
MTQTIAGTGTMTFEAIPAVELQQIRAAGCDEAGGVLAAGGQHAGAAIAELLARPEIELVHLRNVEYRCDNFVVAGG